MRIFGFDVKVLAALALVVVGLLGVLSLAPARVNSQTSGAMSGYAWSDTIGWIQMSGVNVTVDGTLSGYGWSDVVGWIKFGGLNTFPAAGSNAQIVGGALTGWARACSGTASGNCSTMTSRTDGWDGWISLSGTASNGVAYGPTLQSGGAFTGYAWGSDVGGWINFSTVSTTYQPCVAATNYICTGAGSQTITASSTNAQCVSTQTAVSTCVSPQFCSAGSSTCLWPPYTVNNALTVVPQLVPKSTTATISWNVSNATCTVTGTNNDGTAQSTDTASPGVWNSSSGSKTSSPITSQTTYTLRCTGLDGVVQPAQTAIVGVQPVFQER